METNTGLFVFYIFFVGILIQCRFYVLGFLSSIIILSFIIYRDFSSIKNILYKYKANRKEIKELHYYFIKDITKYNDKIERISNLNLINEFGMTGYIIFIFYFGSITYIFSQVFKKVYFMGFVLTILLLIIIFAISCGLFASFVFKYTTIAYCCGPLVAFIIFGSVGQYISDFPKISVLCLFLLFSTCYYIIFTLVLPLHILRNLNSKIIAISALITIMTTLALQASPMFTKMVLGGQDVFITKGMIKSDTTISNDIKGFLMDKTLLRIINDILLKEYSSDFNSMLSIISAGITLSFLIGSVFVVLRLDKAKAKANRMFYKISFSSKKVRYEELIECAYNGGNEYERLIINNDNWLKIIEEYESTVIIRKISFKRKLQSRIKSLI